MKIFRKTAGILMLFSTIFILSECKKETSQTSSVTTPNDCVEQRSAGDGDIISGKYIVAYSSNTNTRSLSNTRISEMTTEVLSRNNITSTAMKQSFTGEPGGFIAELSVDDAARLKNDPGIAAVEPDRIVALSNCFTVVSPSSITWNVQRVGYGNGIGKTAWIIDTGIDFDHPDLTVNTSLSKNFISTAATADDDNGHGTHVAGIIAAKNNAIGTLGVASGATVVALKVLGADGKGTLSAIIQALAYVNTNGKAGDVINMSLGEDENSAILNQQVQNTASRGIYIAIAAGNDAQPAKNYSPGNANGTNIYTVTAIDSLDRFASFSNYGNDVVDYAEPGVSIVSTWKDGQYAKASGTSMATPHLAGLLLLDGAAIQTSGTAKNDPDGVADAIGHK